MNWKSSHCVHSLTYEDEMGLLCDKLRQQMNGQTIDQATGIGGGRRGILKYPPWPKNFGKYPPWRFWEKILKNREKRRKLGKFN